MLTFLSRLSSSSNFFYLCLSCFSFLKLHKLKIPPGWVLDVKVTSKNTNVIGFGIESWINCAWSRGRYQFKAQISNQNYIFIDFYSAQMPHSKDVLGLIPSFMWRLDLLYVSLWDFFIFALCPLTILDQELGLTGCDPLIRVLLPLSQWQLGKSPARPVTLVGWLTGWMNG